MFDRLKEDIKIVFDRDPAARSSFEIFMTYPGIHALIFHRFSHRLWKLNCYFLARLTSHFARFMTGIEIHPGAVLGRRLFIDHGMGVVIGETAIIGDDCTLYHGVTLGGTSWQKGKRHPTLGSCVVVGAGAQVLGPIEISDNVRIGSNSVVVRAVPEGATVVGIPGRVVNEKATKPSPQQEAMAKRIGFDAYGTSVDIPDPVAVAINSMLDHIQVMDKEMERMCQEIKALGGKINVDVIEEMSPQPFDDGTGRSCLGGTAVGK